MSTFTTNKSIEQPASGSYANDWNVPVNADWGIIDTAFGGNTAISVTGVLAGTYALSLSQYQPPNIVFSGTLSANLAYALPAGVGGTWTVYNNTTGAFTIYFQVSGGGSLSLTQGQRSFIVCDGTNMQYADTAYANGVAALAQSNAISTSEAFSSNGSNISSGTVAATYLPLAGTLQGITIAPDPGTTPSGGVFGDVFYYY
jgi:hypothetical protein